MHLPTKYNNSHNNHKDKAEDKGILLGSALSGLGGASVERTLQRKRRDSCTALPSHLGFSLGPHKARNFKAKRRKVIPNPD